jgi:hypothetical protein
MNCALPYTAYTAQNSGINCALPYRVYTVQNSGINCALPYRVYTAQNSGINCALPYRVYTAQNSGINCALQSETRARVTDMTGGTELAKPAGTARPEPHPVSFYFQFKALNALMTKERPVSWSLPYNNIPFVATFVVCR